jgi:hypothetical protein
MLRAYGEKLVKPAPQFPAELERRIDEFLKDDIREQDKRLAWAADLPRHRLFSPRCLECIATVVRIVAAKPQSQAAFEIGQTQVKDQNTKAISTLDWLSAPIEGLIQ